MRWKNAASTISIIVLCSSCLVNSEDFEIESTDSLVECVQCVQLWKSASIKESKVCSNGATTCRGNACFMRQCKHCPVYQYMSGCVNLSPWQIADLELNRRSSELKMRRVGAVLLCEDTFNQTTCICNRRDKCNSIHSRLPFATYSEGLFRGIINFDSVIASIDPRYLEVMSGYHFRFLSSQSQTISCGVYLIASLFYLFFIL
ncbi:unnamed protein product [Caenorhabditis bovis]|uniref:Uncharacterized protein n=1 Tax=Caenorhabditis bovis TaxID=2654633 RepID=A0A8S1EUB3_9PELO|nr:unnamed protein product [Caenorhabditis bovis]